MRDYLKRKGLVTKASGLPPPPVSLSALAAFETDGNPYPDVSSPQMDWRTPNSSKWNLLMLKMLADDFIQCVQQGQYKNIDPDYVNHRMVRMDIIRRLEVARKKLRHLQHPISSFDDLRAQELATARANSRKNGVCSELPCLEYALTST